jgi:hexosaminidase
LELVTANPPGRGDIVFEKVAPRGEQAEEGYAIDVGRERVTVSAAGAAGFFHGVQTLRQLRGGSWPAVAIGDRPRFAWRGLMIDVARRFRSVEWLRALVDRMAELKLNVLHLHLTDDQGWRLPSRRFPKLVEVGSRRRGPAGEEGGAYTEAELRELIAHAARRHVRVVPEIDGPGHVTAALAAYPDLSCRAVPLPVPTNWGTFEDVLCVGSESPFVLLDGLIEEIGAVFPDPLVHVGGDEVPRTRW